MFADIYLGLGDICVVNEMYDAARGEYEKALSYRQMGENTDHRSLSEVYFKLCMCAESSADYPDAAERCNQALEEIKKELAQSRSGKFFLVHLSSLWEVCCGMLVAY